MSITLHTGNPRTGKTYGMTKVVLKALDEGVIVYSNYKIEWRGFGKYPETNLRYWSKLEDLLQKEIPKGSLIVMDEAHVYLNSRRWKTLTEDFERRLAQHGKDGLHIIGSVQNIRRIDLVMRELVDYWYTYTVFPPPPKKPWKKHKPLFFLRYELIPPTDLAPFVRRKSLPAMYPFRKKIANRYDTYQKITT